MDIGRKGFDEKGNNEYSDSKYSVFVVEKRDEHGVEESEDPEQN